MVLALGVTGITSAQLLQTELPDELRGVGITDRRGTPIPPDLTVYDADGNAERAEAWFDGTRPVLLVMAYYDCPLLCTLMLNNIQQVLNGLDWVAGEEFRVVVVSFDHTNPSSMAAQKQATYRLGYVHEAEMPEDGWNFYVTNAQNARQLAQTIGFHYRYLPETGEFSHTAAVFFCSPDGVLHNFIEQLKPSSRDVKIALIEASDGSTASLFERVFAGCFFYNSETGKYSASAWAIMKWGAGGSAVVLFGTLGVLFLTYEVRRRMRGSPEIATGG